ncbi:MAG: 16S rRNA processing protein RimM [Mycoplasmataceae bacterium]|nr:16S rRNA processing protein RimM [Mycoplasmataceae bacterium]
MNKEKNNFLWLGTIVNTHGIKGEVRVLSNSDNLKMRFKVGNSLIYFRKEIMEKIIIKTMRFHKKFILLTFEGVDSINDIEWIKGLKIYCEKNELDDGKYYLSELVDKYVKDQSGEIIGIVTSIFDHGPYESLVIKLNNGNSTNVPMIEEFNFQFDGKIINIKIPKEFIN